LSPHGGKRIGAGRKKQLQDAVTFALDLERKDLEAVRAVAEREGVSAAEMIRRAISVHLAGDRRPRPRRTKTSRS
jgi:hypothetical protein